MSITQHILEELTGVAQVLSNGQTEYQKLSHTQLNRLTFLKKFAILENSKEITESNKAGIKNALQSVCNHVKISAARSLRYQHFVE